MVQLRERDFFFRESKNGRKTKLPLTGGNEHEVDILDEEGNLRTLEKIQEDVIRLAFGLYEGRRSEVARRLGIGRSTLYRMLNEYDKQKTAPD